jgi:hypothetical protein
VRYSTATVIPCILYVQCIVHYWNVVYPVYRALQQLLLWSLIPVKEVCSVLLCPLGFFGRKTTLDRFNKIVSVYHVILVCFWSWYAVMQKHDASFWNRGCVMLISCFARLCVILWMRQALSFFVSFASLQLVCYPWSISLSVLVSLSHFCGSWSFFPQNVLYNYPWITNL